MVHVPDVAAARAWYQNAFPLARRQQVEGTDFEFLLLGEVQLELVQSDQKVGCGPAGSVVYWHAQDFDAMLGHLRHIGATLYRGPMRIEGNVSMCQVQDPWGNCIGIRGSSRRSR
jgi:predicted enzyme related to lactoylglutathione lyase